MIWTGCFVSTPDVIAGPFPPVDASEQDGERQDIVLPSSLRMVRHGDRAG